MSFTVTPTDELHPETGRRIFHYAQDAGSTRVAVYTGPHARGSYTLSDGTQVNVSDDWIEVETPEHFGELSHVMGVDYEQNGHPLHKQRGYLAAHKGETDYDPFVDEFNHVCTSHCGPLRRTATQHKQEFQARLTRLGLVDHIGRSADPENLRMSHDEFDTSVDREYARHEGE